MKWKSFALLAVILSLLGQGQVQANTIASPSSFWEGEAGLTLIPKSVPTATT